MLCSDIQSRKFEERVQCPQQEDRRAQEGEPLQLVLLQSNLICWRQCRAPFMSSLLLQAKQDASELQEQSKELKVRVESAEKTARDVSEERDRAIQPIGNYVHETVPVSNDEVKGQQLTGMLTIGAPPVAYQPTMHAGKQCCCARMGHAKGRVGAAQPCRSCSDIGHSRSGPWHCCCRQDSVSYIAKIATAGNCI